MKPMFALIAVGVLLFFVMFYFGKSSFEGVAETNIYAASKDYVITAPETIKFGKAIKNVQIDANNSLNFTIDGENLEDYEITSIEIENISAKGSLTLKKESENSYSLPQKLAPKSYLAIFHIASAGKNFKVQKTIIVD